MKRSAGSAYTFFVSQNFQAHKVNAPKNAKTSEIVRSLAQQWRKLSELEKAVSPEKQTRVLRVVDEIAETTGGAAVCIKQMDGTGGWTEDLVS